MLKISSVRAGKCLGGFFYMNSSIPSLFFGDLQVLINREIILQTREDLDFVGFNRFMELCACLTHDQRHLLFGPVSLAKIYFFCELGLKNPYTANQADNFLLGYLK